MDLFYKDTVTVWNCTPAANNLWGGETWTPYVITNARLLVSRGNNIQTSGNKEADSARLHVSDDLSTVPVGFAPVADGKAFFTAGDTSSESEGAGTAGNFFEQMKKSYADCYMITSVDRFEIIPHWEIWGK